MFVGTRVRPVGARVRPVQISSLQYFIRRVLDILRNISCSNIVDLSTIEYRVLPYFLG